MLDGIILTITVYFTSDSNRYVYKKSLNLYVIMSVLILLSLPTWQKFQLIICVKYLEKLANLSFFLLIFIVSFSG